MGLKPAARARALRAPEVVVVGAGAVGLMAANLLGRRGIAAWVLDREEKPRTGSRAIGITPPSLALLAELGLDAEFMRQGVQVKQAVLHDEQKELGRLHFDGLDAPHPFILSLPQETAERLLLKNLQRYPSVAVLRGHEVRDLRLLPQGASLACVALKTRRQKNITARWVCACDGKNSTVRALLGLDFPGGRYRQTYLMADFKDVSGLGDAAYFFFTALGPVESFPLPQGRRRWIVETRSFLQNPEPGFIEREVLARTGFALKHAHRRWESPFGTQRHLARRYFKGRVVFCGDAAHIMSPIGGQGMNTGWGDAEFAVQAVAHALQTPGAPAEIFQAYQAFRKKAFRTAAWRAAQLMRLGALKGRTVSGVRNVLIQWAVALAPDIFARYFSMLSIPYRSLAEVLKKQPSLFEKNELRKPEK